ncbi:MAG: hypothetical protein NVSMB57_04070 [Actinomycetota bacterium]
MEKSMLEKINEGDPISVALRGGAGWVHGTLVWRKENVVLMEATDPAVRKETPYVLVMLGDVSAIAVPSKVDPPGTEARSPGFMR